MIMATFYDPQLTLTELEGNEYELTTNVYVQDQESLQLESNTVIGSERFVVFNVLSTGGASGNHDETAVLEYSRQTGEESVEVEVKKDGNVKGTRVINYD